MENLNKMDYSNLCIVLSGGAVKGFGLLGSIQYIDETIGIDKINTFMGTSIGAIISYLLCLGFKPIEIIHNILKERILNKIQSDIDLDGVLERQSIANFDYISEELEIMTLAKFGKTFTMKSLYEELGKELGCVTFNYTKYKPEYIHYKNYPDIPCLKAVQMSSSIPFVFNKFLYNDCLYIDGAVVDNFPIRMAIKCGKTNIIGISTNDYELYSDDKDTKISISKLINIPISEKTYKTIKKFKKKYILINILSNKDSIDFNLDIPDIMEMFSEGYKKAKSILLEN